MKIVVLSRCEQRQTRLLQVLEGYLLTGGMNNYYVKSFGEETAFWRDASQSRPEIVIQIMEPDEQSRKCAQRIRLYYPDIALVLVGAAAELAVFSYEIGAAYYVPEPVRFDQVDKIAAACVRFLGHKPQEIALCSDYGHIAVPWESIRGTHRAVFYYGRGQAGRGVSVADGCGAAAGGCPFFASVPEYDYQYGPCSAGNGEDVCHG